ncbi:MAG: ABC transporter substrate-binding protein [Dehalococcoidia bacterium]|nr:ABC transporter substrate-binding protein [Dehalococcoidia bacterium]
MTDELERLRSLSLSRRTAMRGAALGLGGLAAAALVGCGGDDDADTGAAQPAAAQPAKGEGELVKDAEAPYPYQYPEPAGKTPKAGGVLAVAVSWDSSTLDTTKSAAGGTITIPNTAYDRLLEFVVGPKMSPTKVEMTGGLAESWERSPDGAVYTFKIRPGVKWQNVPPLNGRDFVAADAKFVFERYAKEGVHQALWTDLDKIEAPDAKTLKITLKRPLADFVANLAGRYQSVFPKELVDSGEIDKKAIGTGSMILKEIRQGQDVTFERNPNFWGGKPYLDGINYRIMPDGAARLAAFRAGQVDYAYSPVGKLSEAKAVERSNPGVQISVYAITAGGYGFGMNHQNTKFKDERIRRAISLATDHDTTIAVLFESAGVSLPNTPFQFTHATRPDMKKGELGQWVKPAGDPAEAKKLLDAAGAKDFTINANFYTYAAFDSQRAELLTDQFRKAGITLNARRVDYTEFNSQWVGGKLPEATTSGWNAVGFDADNYFYNQVHSKSPGNRWHIEDTQIDSWAEQQRTELNPEKRKEIHKKIWDRDLDQMYRIPQAAGYYFEVLQPWLRALRWGGGLGVASSYYDWGHQAHTMWLDK